MKKRIKRAQLAQKHIDLFQCPICNESMKLHEFKSLLCLNKHTFDFAKQGYVHLTTRANDRLYTRKLFEARRKMILSSAIYDPLHQVLSEAIESISLKNVLDAGSGEGSHLHRLIESRQQSFELSVGLDLSKEGIKLAATHDENKLWVVGDLANLPFTKQSFDCILSILSPSNYQEFKRILTPNGIVIKVVPGRYYLQELRQHFNDQPTSYSNSETTSLFNENFNLINKHKLSYQVSLLEDQMKSLLEMTPLLWKASKSEKEDFIMKSQNRITIDLDLLIGIARD
ncbi:methyltransferase domain-containing protein [Alkalicoccobacillus porphyridii]|uniref:methyltransferase domain-containing protein n=1 Tax=Alkalicoccobacillus porphyridii TaxID=2597270 RepID=UPI00163DC844|nr:methyltransferase domain-containing protein [Alkalicoccobacillus porphyridii]